MTAKKPTLSEQVERELSRYGWAESRETILGLITAHEAEDRKLADLVKRLAEASERATTEMMQYPMSTERSYRRGRAEAFRVAANWLEATAQKSPERSEP